jgi:hypothetical protein
VGGGVGDLLGDGVGETVVGAGVGLFVGGEDGAGVTGLCVGRVDGLALGLSLG